MSSYYRHADGKDFHLAYWIVEIRLAGAIATVCPCGKVGSLHRNSKSGREIVGE